MIQTIYRGSVKDLLGPVSLGGGGEALIFQYTDSFSVFDWGRMPDTLPKKGEALAMLAASWFERLEQPNVWKDFSRSPEALELRKYSRSGSVFNEIGEKLQNEGLRTHYLGSLPESIDGAIKEIRARTVNELTKPTTQLVVRRVSAVKPDLVSILGRAVPDYRATRQSPAPRLIPLEVVFRFSCPPGSSLLERVKENPGYLSSIGNPDVPVAPGEKWGFPILEMFTKLESSDRALSLTEALAITGISGSPLQEIALKTAWVAGLLKNQCASCGLELADGKLEWGVAADGSVFLVDAIGPDELRLMKNGVPLSKEFLRNYYRPTSWYSAVNRAKKQAETQGIAEWKRLVPTSPPPLPDSQRELASQLYLSLANSLSGRTWFPEAWSLERVAEGIKNLAASGEGGTR